MELKERLLRFPCTVEFNDGTSQCTADYVEVENDIVKIYQWDGY
jgi:hypothetical protein